MPPQAAIPEPLAPFTAIYATPGSSHQAAVWRPRIPSQLAYISSANAFLLCTPALSTSASILWIGTQIVHGSGSRHSEPLHRSTGFYGSALDALREKINREEGLVNKDFYMKTIPIMDELSKESSFS